MGTVLSANEKKQASHYLNGIRTVGLTAVIWDSINQVGLDDVHEHIGIQFDVDDAGYSRVVFWDAEGPSLQMPRKVFLEILLFASNEAFKDIAERTGSSDEVERLARAVTHLQHEVDSCPGQTAEEYSKLLNDGHIPNSCSVQDSVEEVRVRRGTIIDQVNVNSDVDVDNWSSIHSRRRRSTKGINAVVERLPELRKRYEASIITRIRNKLKAISLFRSSHANTERDIIRTPLELSTSKLEVINEENI